MNCKKCSLFNTCEKAKHLENYKIEKCKDFKLCKDLFLQGLIAIHVGTVETILEYADSSGYDRNEVLKRFSVVFSTMTQITNFNNYGVKNENN